jgi:hypothetical protein
MRKFSTDDVVILEGARCSGSDHDGCEKACAIFWRESWLRKIERTTAPPETANVGREQLRLCLKTKTSPKIYFCQASELLNSTDNLSRLDRLATCIDEVRSSNCTSMEMVRRISIWLYWRIRRQVLGYYAKGTAKATPAESLNLQPGELVQVKSVDGISQTLDGTAHNRGLYFTPQMADLCGEQHRVERRIEKIIVDGTGEMRKLRNTVYLEGSMCGCAGVAFGGCPRSEFAYWREIWLCQQSDARKLPPAC